jgi:hypothetical protein
MAILFHSLFEGTIAVVCWIMIVCEISVISLVFDGIVAFDVRLVLALVLRVEDVLAVVGMMMIVWDINVKSKELDDNDVCGDVRRVEALGVGSSATFGDGVERAAVDVGSTGLEMLDGTGNWSVKVVWEATVFGVVAIGLDATGNWSVKVVWEATVFGVVAIGLDDAGNWSVKVVWEPAVFGVAAIEPDETGNWSDHVGWGSIVCGVDAHGFGGTGDGFGHVGRDSSVFDHGFDIAGNDVETSGLDEAGNVSDQVDWDWGVADSVNQSVNGVPVLILDPSGG